MVRQGVISPVLISKYHYENWQLDTLRTKFKLSRKDIDNLVQGIQNDPRRQLFDNNIELDIQIMTAHVNLSYRIDFWMQLKKWNVLIHAKTIQKDNGDIELEERIKHVILVDEDYKNKIPEWMKKLTPVPNPDLETLRYQIRLSNDTEHRLM